MAVFMAGATTKGLSKSQARAVHDSRSSQRPLASLASEFAESGATTSRSAHFRSSTWTTSSPISCQASHSSASERTSMPEAWKVAQAAAS